MRGWDKRALRGGAITYVACRYLVLSGFNASNYLNIVIGEEGSLPAIALYGDLSQLEVQISAASLFTFEHPRYTLKAWQKCPVGMKLRTS